ncbi:MAG: TldD/PmbA family protein [Armatimonadota bacterium]
MPGRDDMLEILRKSIEYSGADMTQATLTVGESSLTRFANSIIHQNVAEKNAELAVRTIIGTRIGYAKTNRLDDESIREVVNRSLDSARHSQENPDFVSLPSPSPISDVDTFDEETAYFSPESRAGAVKDMICKANEIGASSAGALTNGYEQFAVVNSLGINAYSKISSAKLTTVMTSDNGHGYADRMSEHIRDINPIDAAVEAATKCMQCRNPESIEPGAYDVILLPYAVAEFMEFLAYTGFGALAVQEDRSFMSGKFGERITGENISIWDDALDPDGLPRPFDPEGVPKKRVDLIMNGIANAVVYDSYTANKEGKESTGHSTGGTGTFGPMPLNMFMKTGDATVEDMIASTKRGILVTRFHYANLIHPIQTLITGMTRDGTFLIDNGSVVKPLKNLRFTDNILERLSNVEMISRDAKRQDYAVVPAIKVKNFRFTGVTEF